MIVAILAKDPKVGGFLGLRHTGAQVVEPSSITPKLRLIIGVKIVTAQICSAFIPSLREMPHAMRCGAFVTAPAQGDVGCTRLR